jgi:predicted nuclease of predicted toxin-antitoxin system
MRFLLDENMSDRRRASRLKAQGHDPILAIDVGLLSVSDPRVLIWAITQALPVLTRDSEDFTDLHDLLMAAGGHHPGILVVRFDSDPRHNLTDRGITSAIHKLESSGIPIPDRIHVLNQWR